MTEARTQPSFPGTGILGVDKIKSTIEEAAKAVAAGNYEFALSLLNDAIELAPASTELLTAAALVTLRAGDANRAEKYLVQALQLVPKNKDILHNLALLYWGENRHSDARGMLLRLVDVDPSDADGFNDLGVLEDQCGNVADATTAFKTALTLPGATRKTFENCFDFFVRANAITDFRSAIGTYLTRYGEDDVVRKWQSEAARSFELKPNPEIVPDDIYSTGVNGLKIAFFAAFQTFLDPIIADLKKDNEIKLFTSGTDRQMRDLLEWCDLAWFEWCDSLLIAATKMPKRCKIICRLHSYEAFTEMPQQVDWSKVDHLILVNRSVQEVLARSVRIPTPTTIIHNGVDTGKFSIPENKTYGKRICSVGYINYKKNPALLLYCFKAIHDYDPSYRFHIAGAHQDPRIQIYFEHLIPILNIPVVFDGWVEDMPGYLRDKDYVISTSLFESFHYSIAEGMASGVLPLIHDWPGASYLYPHEYLFTTPDECTTLIKRLETQDRQQLGRKCRDFIVSHYDLDKQLAKVNSLVKTVAEGK